VFSTFIPGRVGYQCAEFFRQLIKTGIVAPDNTLPESMDSNEKDYNDFYHNQPTKLMPKAQHNSSPPKKDNVDELSKEEDLFDFEELQPEEIFTDKQPESIISEVTPREKVTNNRKKKIRGDISI